jgi:hypothetical protein
MNKYGRMALEDGLATNSHLRTAQGLCPRTSIKRGFILTIPLWYSCSPSPPSNQSACDFSYKHSMAHGVKFAAYSTRKPKTETYLWTPRPLWRSQPGKQPVRRARTAERGSSIGRKLLKLRILRKVACLAHLCFLRYRWCGWHARSSRLAWVTQLTTSS